MRLDEVPFPGAVPEQAAHAYANIQHLVDPLLRQISDKGDLLSNSSRRYWGRIFGSPGGVTGASL